MGQAKQTFFRWALVEAHVRTEGRSGGPGLGCSEGLGEVRRFTPPASTSSPPAQSHLFWELDVIMFRKRFCQLF